LESDVTFFVFGLFAAVPVGILTNYLTPKVIDRAAQRSQRSARKRVAELRAELEEVTEMYKHPTMLMYKTIRAAFILLVLASVANVVWAAPTTTEAAWFLFPDLRGTPFFAYTYSGFSLLAMVFFLAAIVVGINHLRLVAKVRNYERYQQEVKLQIQALENRH
jgi:hypothetical protein